MENYNLEPISGKKTIKIYSERSDMLTFGVERKFKHKAKLKLGSKQREISLVERRDQGMGNMKYSEQWRLFKDAGLPIVPTLRKMGDKAVIMTDLTSDGSELYGKELRNVLQVSSLDRDEPQKGLSKLNSINNFLRIMKGEEFLKLKDKLREYCNIANQNGIYLPVDDPFELVVHPDGTWNLVIIDLSLGGRGNDYNEGTNIEKSNNTSIIFFERILQEIKKLCSTPI